MRPISLLRLSLRYADSKCLGNCPTDMRIPALRIKTLLESSPLKP